MSDISTMIVPADGMTAMVRHIFEAAGAGGEEAEAIAANLVGANLTGHDSHGVVHVPRYLMWEKSGIVRNEESLTQALNGILKIRLQTRDNVISQPIHLIRRFELLSMLDSSEATVRSALLRKESRGSHFREDFSKQDDLHWLGSVFVHKTEEGCKTRFQPVRIEEKVPTS